MDAFPRITIIAGYKEYDLSVHEHQISDPEIDWLAHKISEWSGVSITRERGLPIE